MNIRRPAALAAVFLLLFSRVPARADQVTLYTASSFASEEEDIGVIYAGLLETFEREHDCVIADSSSASNETWKKNILNEFAAGSEPDILFFFANSADSAPLLPRVVPIEEINRNYPGLNLPVSDALREPDGRVYAIPIRPFWEGILCNTELFDLYDLPLPDTWDHLMEAVAGFRARGVTPFAVSMMDSPHYIAEMAILACATPEEQQARPASYEEVPESWFRAMALIRELAEAGAFPDHAAFMDEWTANSLFHSGKAAMQVDGVWFAKQLSGEEMARTAVLPVPRADGGEPSGAYIGGVSMGFYLTRRAWDQPSVRDLAVRLLAFLTGEENRDLLSGNTLSGLAGETAADLIREDHVMLSPVQDAMNAAAREVWLMECVPAVAEGSMTPEECWRKVMSLSPFQ